MARRVDGHGLAWSEARQVVKRARPPLGSGHARSSHRPGGSSITAASVNTDANPGGRVAGLDTIRFVCALIVVFAHTGQPPLRAMFDDSSTFGWLAGGLLGSLWSSAAAVTIFFVISGFCIHYPHARNLTIPSVVGYGLRRYIRIGVPVVAAIFVSSLVGLDLRLFEGTILWSLAAELIYYTLYPLLLILRRRLGSWMPMLVVSFVAALALAATKPLVGEYPSFGLAGNWLLGLPCWIAGCLLADRYLARPSARTIPQIWLFRMIMWGAMIACLLLRYHSPLGYPWTLNFFALLGTAWLGYEIVHMAVHPPPRLLERIGLWSYSLYLTHKLAEIIYEWMPVPSLGLWPDWFIRLCFILIFAFGFYMVCEKPAHMLARGAARWADRLAARRSAAVASSVKDGD